MLGTIKDAARRLRRWPAAILDGACAFQAPLLRLDGILGRALAQILRTRLFEAELLLKRRGKGIGK